MVCHIGFISCLSEHNVSGIVCVFVFVFRCVFGQTPAEGPRATASVGVRVRFWELIGQRQGQQGVMGQLEQCGGRERPQQSTTEWVTRAQTHANINEEERDRHTVNRHGLHTHTVLLYIISFKFFLFFKEVKAFLIWQLFIHQYTTLT